MSALSEIAQAAAALRAGELVVLPTDTVYGLACSASDQAAAQRLYELKGRREIQPTALMAVSVEVMLACIPELEGRWVTIAHALLPGPVTLVLPNPARRFAWLTGDRKDTIGVRVPALTAGSKAILDAAGAIVATSANLSGGPDPRTLAQVPLEILRGVAAAIDGGELPGTPSTVLDITGAAPVVLREGALSAVETLRLLAEATASHHTILTP